MRKTKAHLAGVARTDAVFARIESLLPLAVRLKLLDGSATIYGSLLDEMMSRADGHAPVIEDRPGALVPAQFLYHLLETLRLAFAASIIFKTRGGDDGWKFLSRQIGLAPVHRAAKDGGALLGLAEAAASFAEGYLGAVSDARKVLAKKGELATAAKKQTKADKAEKLVAAVTLHGGKLDPKARDSIGGSAGVGWSGDTVRKRLAELRRGGSLPLPPEK